MRRGSVSSWEPWARRNSANMAQIAGSRSEFMTSDLGLSDIEYKRKGGCFLSHKKTAVITVIFIIGVIAAGVIGAYVTSWNKNRTITALALSEEDEIEALIKPAKFTSSPSIIPTLYTIELNPMLEESTVKKLSGQLILRFNYTGSEPLSQLVLNAKGITVSKAKLFSKFDDNHSSKNSLRSRKRRDDNDNEGQPTPNSEGNNSSDTTISDIQVTSPGPEITTNEEGISLFGNSSSVEDPLNITSASDSDNSTASGISNDNVTVDDTLNLTTTPGDIVTLRNDLDVEKISSVLTGASSEQPIVVQKVLPTVTSRPISPDNFERGTEIPIANDEMDGVDGFYVVYPQVPIERGEYSVEITYETKVDGVNTFENFYELEGQRKWMLATKLKPLGAQSLFPNFDEQDSKARFSLSVSRPRTLITLANMPLRSSDSVSEDRVMDHFEKSPSLSSNNLAFLIGDFQPITEMTAGENKKTPLTLWSKSSKVDETRFITDKIETVTKILDQFFSAPYTMPKLDLVAIPGIFGDGIGSPGLIFIRESLFYMTEDFSAISKELAIKNLVKLIGEQWLGGLVTAKKLSDTWILEGSLIYLEHLLTEQIDPTIDSSNSMGILQHDSFETDFHDVSKTLDSKFSLANLESTYPHNAYRKGACLIRMLHSVISDSGFRNGYKKFLSRWMNTSPSVSDFWTAMSDEADSLPDDISLSKIMTSWVSQGGFPLLTIKRNYDTGSALVRQEQFTFDNSTISKRQFWYIPLTYVIEGDDWSSPRKTWFKKEEEMNIEDFGNSGDKKWVLFNVNQTGYYRVNYDLDNWKLLSSALNSTSEKFPVNVRTSLVDDVLSLAWAGRLEYSTALNLIRYLREKETHHSPWTVALRNIIKLNNLLHDTPAYSSFQEFMIKFISPLFKKLTPTSPDSRLKLMAIEWACLIDNPECYSYVKSLSSVPDYLVEIHQCTIARFGGKSEWDSLLNKTSNAEDKGMKLKLLTAFPCFRVEWILQSILRDILDGEKFDVTETLVLLKNFGDNPAASRSALKFVRRNWNEIFERFSKSYPISKAFLVAAARGISDDQDLKDIFKEDYYENLKFMGHTISVSEAEARSRIFWLKKNLLPVKEWLDNFIGMTS